MFHFCALAIENGGPVQDSFRANKMRTGDTRSRRLGYVCISEKPEEL